MRALVTGGGGFLGRWIVGKLLARGDGVRVLGRRAYPDLAAAGVETVKADVNDAGAVRSACAGMDAVFHVAALPAIWGPRQVFVDTNVRGTENVLQGCLDQGVGRLVYTSTPSVVYGREPIRGGDTELTYPATYLADYPATKAAAEKRVLACNGEKGLWTCALRPHLIWGPGDTNLIPRLMARSRAGRLVRVGDGTNRISVCYVENGADAHLAACDRLGPDSPVAGQAYFVCEPEPVNCWDFVGQLLAGLGCPAVKRAVSVRTAYVLGAACEGLYSLLRLTREPPMTRFLALQLGTDHWFDTSRTQHDLAWRPAVGMEEGLARLCAAVAVPE